MIGNIASGGKPPAPSALQSGTICAPAPGTTLAGNDRPRAFPNRRPEVHNYPLGATSTPVFEKDLLRADGDGTGRSTHANQVLFAKYARSYIAINTLGHVHQRQVLHEGPHVVFPGNLQGRHIRETGPKGACLVTVRDHEVAAVELIALDVVRWSRVQVPVEGTRSLAM